MGTEVVPFYMLSLGKGPQAQLLGILVAGDSQLSFSLSIARGLREPHRPRLHPSQGTGCNYPQADAGSERPQSLHCLDLAQL